jgi:hypothetical protein
MINVRDASFQRIQGLSLPFQVRRDLVSDGLATRCLGLVRSDEKRKIVSSKKAEGKV